ncbi:JAC1 [[Candida] subhashii]|uniref:JAC1 n=1 Tax=[Candida] subhashii TaxID=561895 RepID=A0A8J5QN66_9ASCO|nr:JAC1 [[Candida] subhashii]KAG7663413.1 JAC1 [[Candida] subhashii]
MFLQRLIRYPSQLSLLRRYTTNGVRPITSYFQLFPKSFPNGGPPKDSFLINPRQLRREYRELQSENHPDVLIGSSFLSDNRTNDSSKNDFSSVINRGYVTLKNPYTRIAHYIKLNHPDHLDITQDDVSKRIISEHQNKSMEDSLEYKNILMEVLEAHEQLELANSESEFEGLEIENNSRIENSENLIEQVIQEGGSNWDELMMLGIQLKYWVNIQNAIKEWEPGKPVHLTH